MAYTLCLTRETRNSINSGSNNHNSKAGKCRRQRHQTTSIEIVLIITEEAAAAPLASSHMFVADVDHQLTQHHFVHNESSNNKAVQQQQPCSQTLQLVEETYVPPMPLKHNQLSELLNKYPDSVKVDYVIQSLIQGFALEYTGQFRFHVPENLPMAKLDPQLIRDQLNKEIALDRMLGPFKDPPFPDLMCSPIGLVPKKDTDEM